MEGDPENIGDKIGLMPFGEQTATIGDVMEESHGGGVSMSSHLHSGWRGEVQIGELTAIGEVSIDGGKYSSRLLDIGEVSTLGSHGTWVSLICVTKDVDDVSFTVARR